MRESDIVPFIIGNCGSKSGRDSIHFYSVPSIITNQGEEFEELTRERQNLWISAIDRADLKTKHVLKNERVCSRHFVSGRPAANWNRLNDDWVPTRHVARILTVLVNTHAPMFEKCVLPVYSTAYDIADTTGYSFNIYRSRSYFKVTGTEL